MNKIPLNDVTDNKHKKVETYDLYEKRQHIYTKFYKGLYKNLRLISGAFMLILFYGTSWLEWGGRQAVLFDLPSRQFHVFGATFWPQDFILLSLLLIILAFVLFVVTVFAGRLWCGYACPQFLWTWLFMWAERITEGDRNQRMRQDKKAMNRSLFLRKTAKHTLWVIISLLTAIAFMGYFTPIRELISSLFQLTLGPWEFWWVGFITVATYGNAGWLREQVCIYMCPYARFQSVMFDSDTLIISYDEKRGENRGKRSRKTDTKAEGLGDCIDCNHCVNVCPTGIDIRDGLQVECVACGACIDACDDIMTRIGSEKGLIKYTTETNLDGGNTKFIRPKLIAYFVLVLAMVGYFSYVILERSPIELSVKRDRGQLFVEVSDQLIANIYTLKITNKSNQQFDYDVSVSGIKDLSIINPEKLSIAAGDTINHPIRVRANTRNISTNKTTITFKLTAKGSSNLTIEVDSKFISPKY